MEQCRYDPLLNPGEECQNDYVCIEQIVRFQRLGQIRFADQVRFIFNMDAYSCQWGIVERAESVEVFSVDFSRAVATHQMVFKKMQTSGTIAVPSGFWLLQFQ